MHYRRNARPHGRARRRGIAIADEDIPHRLARRRHRSRCRLSRQRRLSAGPARRWLRRGAQRGDRVSLATGNVDRLPQLATELVRAPVDVIVTSGEPAAIAAKQATKTIPIIVTQIGADPVKAGLVTSLARPGGERHRTGHAERGAVGETSRVAQGSRAQRFAVGGALESGQPRQRKLHRGDKRRRPDVAIAGRFCGGA